MLPCQTSHVQSPLDTVGYGGQGLMISAAGLERNNKKDRREDCYSWKELITRKETELADKIGFRHNEQSK